MCYSVIMLEIDKIRPKIEELAKKYQLSLMVLFGSQVEQKYLHKESDFDIAYLSEKDLDLMEEAKLICDLMPIFGSDKVELVNLKKTGPLLMKQIFEKHNILHCKDSEIYHRYKIYALKRYIEAQPLFSLRNLLIKKFFQKYA